MNAIESPSASTAAGQPRRERPVTVVYLAYGAHRLVRCAAFSALTFSHVARTLQRPSRIVVYTDQPAIFTQYGLTCDFVPFATLHDGRPAYPYRTKILATQHAATHFDGDIFFVDGDTYFFDTVEPQLSLLSPAHSIMHKAEYALGGDRLPDLLADIRAGRFASPALRAAQAWPELTMWNAGAIGVAEENKHVIADVLAISDELYAAFTYHTCEQIAWMLVLSQCGELIATDAAIYHYWDGQEELTHRIVSFLRRNRKLAPDALAAKAYGFRPQITPSWTPPLAVRSRVLARSLLSSYRTIGRGGEKLRDGRVDESATSRAN